MKNIKIDVGVGRNGKPVNKMKSVINSEKMKLSHKNHNKKENDFYVVLKEVATY